jgi:hypothetical protein
MALQLLQEREIGTGALGQGGKAQGHGEGGEGNAEQTGQQLRGVLGWLASRSRLICRAA